MLLFKFIAMFLFQLPPGHRQFVVNIEYLALENYSLD